MWAEKNFEKKIPVCALITAFFTYFPASLSAQFLQILHGMKLLVVVTSFTVPLVNALVCFQYEHVTFVQIFQVQGHLLHSHVLPVSMEVIQFRVHAHFFHLFQGGHRLFFRLKRKHGNCGTLVETAGTFYMLQACMESNFL